MNLTPLRYLRLVVEHGTFAAAAAAAGVSQPAVSQALQQLQARLGEHLFEREGRRLRPNARARQLARHSHGLEEQLQDLLPPASAAADPALLRVGLTASAARVCGPLLVAHWCGAGPGRRLAMRSADEGQLIAGLQRRALDLAITPRPRGPMPTGLSVQPLYRLTPRVYGRRGHPLASTQRLQDLQSACFAAVGAAVAGPVDVLTEAFEVRRLPPPQVQVQCADYGSLVQLLAQTDLLAVLPHPALLGEGAAGAVRPLPLRETLPLYDMVLLRAAGTSRLLGPLVRQLRQALAGGPQD